MMFILERSQSDGPRKLLALASLLLLAAATSSVSSMPARVEPQSESTTMTILATTSATSQQQPETRIGGGQRRGEFACVSCRGQIPRGNYFGELPCGHRLHFECLHAAQPAGVRYGFNCPICGLNGELGLGGRLMRRDMANGALPADFDLSEPPRSGPATVRVNGSHVADDVSAEEIMELFEQMESSKIDDDDDDDDDDEALENEAEVCAICLAGVRRAKTSLGCGHEFHEKCIAGWFRQLRRQGKEKFCPVCRREHH